MIRKDFVPEVKDYVVAYEALNGHIVEIKNIPNKRGETEEFYYDNGEKVDRSNLRPCINCGKKPTEKGHDACLGELPRVKYACCGHGEEGYILFNNGIRIEGKFRLNLIKNILLFPKFIKNFYHDYFQKK